MTFLRDAAAWVDRHSEIVLDLVRVYLGIGLFVRGILFVTETKGIATLVDLSEFSLVSGLVAHYVTFVHLLGGLLLAVGLLTRISALLQMPILIGALFFVHWQEGLLSANQSLEFAALVLFLLVVVFLWGPGRWSADYYVFVREPEIHAEEELETWWRTEERVPVPVGAAVGETATATEVASGAATRRAPDVEPCPCGHDLTHPEVTVEPRYGWSAGFFFMLGISAPVKEVIFYCQQCGTILKRSRDPELRRKYRWHTS